MGLAVTDGDFAQEVLQASEPVLVDFWAEWCGPCKAMDPILDDLAVEMAGKVKIVKVDAETNPATVSAYNVRSMPTLMVFHGGAPVDMKVGAGQSRVQLVKWLEAYAS
jgi:thioredoxin 1